MREKLEGIEARYEELEKLLADPAVAGNYNKLREFGQERADLQPIVDAYREYQSVRKELEDARTLAADTSDDDLLAMAQEEVARLEARLGQIETDLRSLLLPRDPKDDKNVIVEIRAGTGGDEAGLFAADLYRMYTRYAETHNWKTELLSSNETGVGGFKEVICLVKGKGAYSRLKYESGVHRVQRVPVTEAQGRIHTSTATVAVLPEVEEVEVQIPEKDIEIEVYKSAGAGGQNVQKNSTAVRIRHLPTGIVVQCQDERSQLQNKMRAMSILRARLYELEEQKRQSERTDARRSQVGTGERSEKIRTYNFPQDRVTDHRINITLHNLPRIMDGQIGELIDELTTAEQARQLEGQAA